MGLDAVVYCDCVEKRRLKTPHPLPQLLYIASNGSPEIHSEDEAELEQHDAWLRIACKHEEMMIEGGCLGSAFSIDLLQTVLLGAIESPAREFPVLWKKVIYCGTHCGDHLTVKSVRRLNDELTRFRKISFASLRLPASDLSYINEFREKLKRIVRAAIKIEKPIAF